MQKFVANYEDAAKSEAEAKARGWDAQDGGMLDFLNGDPPRNSQVFPTKAAAHTWLLAEIKADKTLFGCGDIDVYEQPKRRCQYCTCKGWVEVRSFLVDNDGTEEEREVSDTCCNDD